MTATHQSRPPILAALRLFAGATGLVFVVVAFALARSGGVTASQSSILLAGLTLVCLATLISATREEVLLFMYIMLVGYAGGITAIATGLPRKLWSKFEHRSDNRKLGIFKSDPVFGFTVKPNSTGHHVDSVFDVIYTIDGDYCRQTSTPPVPRGDVLFLGCSYTFGDGVRDDECYPAVLANEYWTDFKVRNRALLAWGTTHAYLALKQELERTPLPRVVIYGWMDDHLQRNYLRKSWLEAMDKYGRRNPYFELEDGHLVFKGLVGPENGREDSSELRLKEQEITGRLLQEMSAICRQKEVPFFVVRLPRPWQGDDSFLISRFKDDPLHIIDSTGAHGSFYSHSRHPKADLYREIAKVLANSEIRNVLYPQTAGQ